MIPHFKRVVIVGVGLIGGSLGIVLKQKGLADRVVGLGRTLANLELAVELGAIDQYERDPLKILPEADLVILATPVEQFAEHLKDWGKNLSAGTIVSDVGSVKGNLVEQAEELLPEHVHFVGAHPIAGKEKSGVQASSPTLFQGATCILTPTPNTHPEALSKIDHLWKATGSSVISLDPYLHDWVFGAVSHLPHVIAFALMNTLGDLQSQNPDEGPLLSFSGAGLRDTTRIAGSSPEMWKDICLWNRDNLLTMIETYEAHLGQFKQLLQSRDSQGLERKINQARDLRTQLP